MLRLSLGWPVSWFWLRSLSRRNLLVCVVSLSACASSGAQPTAASTTSESASVVSVRPPEGSTACDETNARAVITGFVHAFNSNGDDPMSFIADAESFKWFSDDLRGARNAGAQNDSRLDPYNRSTLGEYLEWQQQLRPVMMVAVLELTYIDEADMTAGFQVELEWGGNYHLGKVAVDCEQLKIIVFSVGVPLP